MAPTPRHKHNNTHTHTLPSPTAAAAPHSDSQPTSESEAASSSASSSIGWNAVARLDDGVVDGACECAVRRRFGAAHAAWTANASNAPAPLGGVSTAAERHPWSEGSEERVLTGIDRALIDERGRCGAKCGSRRW